MDSKLNGKIYLTICKYWNDGISTKALFLLQSLSMLYSFLFALCKSLINATSNYFDFYFYLYIYSAGIFIPIFIGSQRRSGTIFPSNSITCRLAITFCTFAFYLNISLFALSALISYWKIVKIGKKVTCRRAWCLVLLVYLNVIVLLLPPTTGFWAKITYYKKIGICLFDFSSITTSIDQKLYLYLIMYPMFFICSSIIICSYYRIYCVVRRSLIALTQHETRRFRYDSHHFRLYNRVGTILRVRPAIVANRSFRRHDIALAKTLLLVLLLFIISYIPYALCNILYFTNVIQMTLTHELYLLLLCCLNSVFNPVIFYYRRRNHKTRPI